MTLTPQQVADFHRDGYVIAKGFFSPQEAAKLYATAIEDEAISQHSYNVVDQSGKKSKLALWFTPGDDIYGLMARSKRMVNSVAALLGDTAPVCHFHSKLMQKEPKVGGAWDRTADAVAPGLWLLVQKSILVSRANAVGDGGFQRCHHRKWLLAGHQRLAQIGAGQSWFRGRASRCRRCDGRKLPQIGHGTGLCRTQSGRRALFSFQPPAPLRCQPIRKVTLVVYFGLQLGFQCAVQ
jgi:hypothetical protein